MPPMRRSRRPQPTLWHHVLQAIGIRQGRRRPLPGDIQDFLAHYPSQNEDSNRNENLDFYLNARRCRPDLLLITDILHFWHRDYTALEENHGYIQWLFPIREHSMNTESQPLYTHEIVAMKADTTVCERILAVYRLMLDFYGMRLSSSETGLIERLPSARICVERYTNLLCSPHNNMRITRMLKFLSEMGYERLNAGFVLHVLNEQSERRKLQSQVLRRSMDRWWANCFRNKHERKVIAKVIGKVRDRSSGFIFTRKMYENALEKRRKTGKLRI